VVRPSGAHAVVRLVSSGMMRGMARGRGVRSWADEPPLGVKLASVAALFAMALALSGAAWARQHPAVPGAGTTPGYKPAAAPAPVDNAAPLAEALEAGGPVQVVGLGSSVGAGATLPAPATQAPVAHFAADLRDANPGLAVNVANLSINGSVVVDGLAAYRSQGRALKPAVVVIAYGMNDGLPGAYNSGETFPGAIDALTTLVGEIRADGATVVLLTTPSPHTERADFTMPSGLPVNYPTPGGEPAPLPDDSVVSIDGVPFSARHADYNAKVVDLAQREGLYLGDAAAAWRSAVKAQGQDALFNAKEFVHPNLQGHMASYWPALDDVAAQVQAAVKQ
jgi:lysophospholipase L1-like esterase